MNIEEDIKNLKAYIELVIEKNYCDCNELNTICYGSYGDGSKNVAKSIENILTAYEKEKEKNKELKERLDNGTCLGCNRLELYEFTGDDNCPLFRDEQIEINAKGEIKQ